MNKTTNNNLTAQGYNTPVTTNVSSSEATVVTLFDRDSVGRVRSRKSNAMGSPFFEVRHDWQVQSDRWVSTHEFLDAMSSTYFTQQRTDDSIGRRSIEDVWEPGLSGGGLTTAYQWAGPNRLAGTVYDEGSDNIVDFDHAATFDAFGAMSSQVYMAGASPVLDQGIERDVLGRIRTLDTILDGDATWQAYEYDTRGSFVTEWNHTGALVGADGLIGTHGSATNTAVSNEATTLGAIPTDRNRESAVGSLSSIVETDGQTQTTKWELDTVRDTGYRLTGVKVAGASYNVAHDTDGRVVEAFGQKQYFDPLGRLAFVTDSASNVIESYLYDAHGRLVAVNDHTVTPTDPDPTVFVYDGEQIASAFEEIGGAWAQKFHAVWGPGQDNLVEFFDQQNGETMQIVKDHRNSVVAARLVTQAGAIPDKVKYTPEGRKVVTGTNACDETTSATTVCEGPSGIPFGFNAMWTSSKTGYVYMRNRWYAPRLGEFLSQDPMGFVDSYNLYGHVSFDPINRWDPWGMDDRLVEIAKSLRELGLQSNILVQAAENTDVKLGKPLGTGAASYDDGVMTIPASTLSNALKLTKSNFSSLHDFQQIEDFAVVIHELVHAVYDQLTDKSFEAQDPLMSFVFLTGLDSPWWVPPVYAGNEAAAYKIQEDVERILTTIRDVRRPNEKAARKAVENADAKHGAARQNLIIQMGLLPTELTPDQEAPLSRVKKVREKIFGSPDGAKPSENERVRTEFKKTHGKDLIR